MLFSRPPTATVRRQWRRTALLLAVVWLTLLLIQVIFLAMAWGTVAARLPSGWQAAWAGSAIGCFFLATWEIERWMELGLASPAERQAALDREGLLRVQAVETPEVPLLKMDLFSLAHARWESDDSSRRSV